MGVGGGRRHARDHADFRGALRATIARPGGGIRIPRPSAEVSPRRVTGYFYRGQDRALGLDVWKHRERPTSMKDRYRSSSEMLMMGE